MKFFNFQLRVQFFLLNCSQYHVSLLKFYLNLLLIKLINEERLSSESWKKLKFVFLIHDSFFFFLLDTLLSIFQILKKYF